MVKTSAQIVVIDDHRVVGLGVKAAFEDRGADASAWLGNRPRLGGKRGQVAVLDHCAPAPLSYFISRHRVHRPDYGSPSSSTHLRRRPTDARSPAGPSSSATAPPTTSLAASRRKKASPFDRGPCALDARQLDRQAPLGHRAHPRPLRLRWGFRLWRVPSASQKHRPQHLHQPESGQVGNRDAAGIHVDLFRDARLKTASSSPMRTRTTSRPRCTCSASSLPPSAPPLCT